LPNPSAGAPARSTFANALLLLAERPFLVVWGVGAATGVARWLELLAVGLYVFDRTGSPFLVALFTMIRMLPLTLFGAICGAVAERVGHRRIVLIGLAAMTALSLILVVITQAEGLALWHLALASFLSGSYWATDLPTRRTMLGLYVGPERLAAGMGFDSSTSNATRAVGPALGGLILGLVGLSGVFVLSTILYGLSFLAMLAAPALSRSGSDGPGIWRTLIDGFRYLRGNRHLLGILAITIIFNLWGFPFTSMIPVIGRESLDLSAFGVGLLASAEGSGAFLAAVVVAFTARAGWFVRIYMAGALICLLMVLVLSVAHGPLAAGAAIGFAGLGAGCFSAMQSTIIFSSVPAAQRSRMMGVLALCIGSGQIGFLHLGILADWLGAAPAVGVMAIEGLIALAIVAIWMRRPG